MLWWASGAAVDEWLKKQECKEHLKYDSNPNRSSGRPLAPVETCSRELYKPALQERIASYRTHRQWQQGVCTMVAARKPSLGPLSRKRPPGQLKVFHARTLQAGTIRITAPSELLRRVRKESPGFPPEIQRRNRFNSLYSAHSIPGCKPTMCYLKGGNLKITMHR